MDRSKGFYALVQFCPDLSRLEAANIGVVLLCPDLDFVQVRMSEDNSRARKFFGKIDAGLLELQKAEIKDRLNLHAKELLNPESFADFAGRRGNQIRITELRYVAVQDPVESLDALYRELLGEGADLSLASQEPVKKRKRRILSQFRSALEDAGVAQLVQTDLEIPLPNLSRSISVPFGYQNGLFNIIEPTRFDLPKPDENFEKACRRAIEGEALRDQSDPVLGRLGLTVVGKFGADDELERKRVREILEPKGVRFYEFGKLAPLVDDIRHAAAMHGFASQHGARNDQT
jgi:hypothetical protein